MDRIEIENLRLRCIVGINKWEREKRQDVIISLTLHADTHPAASSDDIEDTVNYRTLAKQVIDHVETSDYCLVEALAENIARICLADARVMKAEVSVRKPGALRFADSVGVVVSRERHAS